MSDVLGYLRGVAEDRARAAEQQRTRAAECEATAARYEREAAEFTAAADKLAADQPLESSSRQAAKSI